MNARHLIFLGVLVHFGCQSPGQWTPESPTVTPLPTLQATMTFTDRNGEKRVVNGPVMVTDNERADGLMFRKKRLSDSEAMLFVMDKTDSHSFWMKNTYIPLDMVFVSEQGTIVGVLDNVPPHTTEPREVDKPSRFIIELDGGWCERHGVTTNSKVVINIAKMTI